MRGNNLHMIDRRRALLGASALGLDASFGAAVPAMAQSPAPVRRPGASLTISTWGGSTQDSIRKLVQPVFERQTGATLVYDIGNQGVRLNKLLAQRASPPADIFFCTEEGLLAGHHGGVLMPARRANLPLLADLYDWAMTVKGYGSADSVAGVPYSLLSFVLAYNTEKVKEKPTSWADLWNPEYSGKIGMPPPDQSLMPEWLTIANELAGGTAADYTPGFKKLAELRPLKLTSFWTDWAPLAKTGDILLVPEFDYYVETMKQQNYPVDYVIPNEKGIAAPEYVGMVKGTKDQELAEAFLNVMLDPGVQTALAVTGFQGPTNKNVTLAPDVASHCSCGPRVARLRFFDVEKLVTNRPAWMERLTTEVLPEWGKRG
jgi:putative spermidine/putrescine transport system substrate-binding protein